MITLLRLLLCLTFCKFVLFCVQGWGYIGEKRARVYELRGCKLLTFCVQSHPGHEHRQLVFFVDSGLFVTFPVHSCSKYVHFIHAQNMRHQFFVARALEVLANIHLFYLVSLPRQIHHEFDELFAIQRAWMCDLSGVCLGGCFLISLESSEILVRF